MINYGLNSEVWTDRIRAALDKAERMSRLHNTPCHLIDGSKLFIQVKLDSNLRPNDRILETVNPPAKRQFK